MRRRSRRQDRGFSLMVVSLLVLVMVGLAGTVALSTRADLAAAGQGREAKTAFYAAEYALAEGQAWVAAQPFDAERGWSALLSSGARELCRAEGDARPGSQPKMAPRPFDPRFVTSGGDEILWMFCVHNDAADPAWLSHEGEKDDARDPLHQLVVEGWGWYGRPPRVASHVSLTLRGAAARPGEWLEH
jgi:hypothetical protein